MTRQTIISIYLVFLVHVGKSQLAPGVLSNISEGCAPLTVMFNCSTCDKSSGTGAWSVGASTYVGLWTSIIFPTPGVYTVTFTLVNGTSKGTATLGITVRTSSADGCKLIGINETPENSNLLISPNPVKERLIISSLDSLDHTLLRYIITGNMGQRIREDTIEIGNHSFEISTSDLEPGAYQLHLITKFGLVIKRFLKIE